MPTTTLTPSRRAAWLGFIVVLAASVMDLLDSTIAQTAAPAIRRDLGGSYAAIEWISAAYTLAMAVTLMLGSRLGDVLGRRRVLLLGIGGFVGASALCAMAPSSNALIAARALQGAVAAIMVPLRRPPTFRDCSAAVGSGPIADGVALTDLHAGEALCVQDPEDYSILDLVRVTAVAARVVVVDVTVWKSGAA